METTLSRVALNLFAKRATLQMTKMDPCASGLWFSKAQKGARTKKDLNVLFVLMGVGSLEAQQ